MAGGRPSKCTPELRADARAYITEFWDKHGHHVPSIVGMSIVLKVGETTLKDWANPDHASFNEEFSTISKDCMAAQHFHLTNKGLGNETNAQITKLMLTKHGYSDKQEVQASLIELDRVVDLTGGD
jgi:hypothetical protein